MAKSSRATPIGPADNLPDAYRALEKDLGDRELFDAYYVERADSPAERLETQLRTSDTICHVLYLGQPKSGKTTELLRLARKIEDKYFVVFLSALEDMEPSDVKPIDLLLLSATRLYEQAAKEGVKVGPDIEKDLRDWLLQNSGETFRTTIKEKTKGGGVEAGLKVVVAKLGGSFRVDSTLREEIRTRLAPRVADLCDKIEILCAKIQQKLGREPLVIIDDLEKIDLATQEVLFHKHAATLSTPGCMTIYTASKAMCYLPSWTMVKASFPAPVEVPSIRTSTRDGGPFPPGLDLLRSILLKRMKAGLLVPEALDKLVTICNGVLSDLFAVCKTCCLEAIAERAAQITWQMVDRNHQSLTDDFRRMIHSECYHMLGKVHATRTAEVSKALSELMQMQAVIEYKDEKGIYYDVHPAVVPLLPVKSAK
jgi:hypothetical protein